jgi:hypothetical protein
MEAAVQYLLSDGGFGGSHADAKCGGREDSRDDGFLNELCQKSAARVQHRGRCDKNSWCGGLWETLGRLEGQDAGQSDFDRHHATAMTSLHSERRQQENHQCSKKIYLGRLLRSRQSCSSTILMPRIKPTDLLDPQTGRAQPASQPANQPGVLALPGKTALLLTSYHNPSIPHAYPCPQFLRRVSIGAASLTCFLRPSVASPNSSSHTVGALAGGTERTTKVHGT